MTYAAMVEPEVAPPPAERPSPRKQPEFPFQSLVVTAPARNAGRRSATLGLSIVLHTVLILMIIVVPLYFYDVLPDAGALALRAFFVAPPNIAPPPPPPPPPPASAIRARVAAPTALKPVEPAAFTAPVEVPDKIVEEPAAVDFGVEGGVPGGVEGGVPGGVVGGIVGGLPQAAPPTLSPVPTVRIGGHLVAPKRVHAVEPVYPELARAARVSAILIVEALVGVDGRVKTVKVLRGHPLLDEPAIEAVQQWRYQPLLLNGQPTQFILTVTIVFNLREKIG
jgi:protein TonB